MGQTQLAWKRKNDEVETWIEDNTTDLKPTAARASKTTLRQWGMVPRRSVREGKVGELPEKIKGAPCKIKKSTKYLTYVNDITDIKKDGPIHGKEEVEAWTLENEHIAVKGVLLGGNLMGFVDKETDEEYLWLNKEGATGYGAGSDAFPLTRGLFLHGGIRMAAVTAEHGLYYDTDWDLDFELSPEGDEASLIFSIQDTAETRAMLDDNLSCKGFSSYSPESMKNYPVTDAIFKFKVTLRSGEKFLRTECSVENTRDEPVQAEAWMPQTWPIDKHSQIVSHQKKRRIKAGSGAYVSDTWVMSSMMKDKYVASDMGLDPDSSLPYYSGEGSFTTNGKEGPKDGWVVSWPPAQLGITEELKQQGLADKDYLWGSFDLNFPLQWPSPDGGITYDYPYLDGKYHAVAFGGTSGETHKGRGVAYVPEVSTEEKPHFTKMWSWGMPEVFNRVEAAKKDPPLAAGRPVQDYYEPWASAFNTAFFELYQFPAKSTSSWKARFVPITEGLDIGKKQHELREVVDAAVEDAVKSFEE